ncbi:MAG TPA: ABC transporter permease [Lachnospiraceae bacterium]|nr:ABC transporter permease [Lachnospiraceae bacterium]
MGNIIKTEFKKLKGSSMLWIGIGSCFILPIMALGINLSRPGKFTWMQYVSQNLWPQIILLWPCIFGVFGAYIFCRESIENTYKNLLIIPVGRIQLAVGKITVMFVSIISMSLFTYCLNLSGVLIGVTVTPTEFMEGLQTYLLAGILMFVCILPVMLVSIIVKKGFLLSICISIVYSLASFLASWVPLLAALLPIDVAWRIMDLKQFEMSYSFPMWVSYASLAFFTVVSIVGILYVSKKQDV